MNRDLVVFLFLILTAGCARHDSRLYGTWHSNRDATVVEIFQRNPSWTNASPDRVERLRKMFGQLTLTYNKNSIRTEGLGENSSFAYRVLESGSNYVVIQDDELFDRDRKIYIRFTNSNNSYWIDGNPMFGGIAEKFDKIK